jgi:predicted transposase YbfD/YdcC
LGPREEALLGKLAVLPDPRKERGKRHLLYEVLFIGVCAVVCGAKTFVEMEVFAKAKEEWLRKRLELANGIPSHDTFRRVFASLEPGALMESLLSWTLAWREPVQGEVLALDGKSLRRSFDKATGKECLHLVSVWATQEGMSLGQEAVADKSNEIKAVPALLERLDIKGCLITADAMHCQKETAAKIREGKGDYLLALKDNHPKLQKDVEAFFEQVRKGGFERKCQEPDTGYSYHEEIDKGHGRVEIRRCYVVQEEQVRWLWHRKEWKDLGSVVAVERHRKIGDKRSVETRYYVTSLRNGAEQIARSVRAHWGIENGLHWVLDVCFREDECRVRMGHAAENLAALRKIALSILRRDTTTKAGMEARRLRAALDTAYLESLLAR